MVLERLHKGPGRFGWGSEAGAVRLEKKFRKVGTSEKTSYGPLGCTRSY